MAPREAVTEIATEAKDWRRHLHQYPELLFDLPKTSSFVAEKLREFGCDEVVTGIAKSGVVGVIKGGRGVGRTLGFRADMDALPISEETNLAHSSKVPNRMHACGHDGHTATLLAAAKHLAATRNFAGTVVVVFQPAEEGGGGAGVMIEEGLVERFAIDEFYAMHIQPGLPVGAFATRPGAFLGAGDRFIVTLNGLVGHAAYPHKSRDPIVAGAHLITALQTISSRYANPFDPVVVTVTYITSGERGVLNVIPGTLEIGGTIRTMSQEVRKSLEDRFRDMVEATAKLFEMQAEIEWRPGYPVSFNDPTKTAVAVAAARSVSGDENVDDDYHRTLGSEDFAYMLQKRPGAYVWFGNGDSEALHNPAFDFNDEAIIHGMKFWLALVERELAPRT